MSQSRAGGNPQECRRIPLRRPEDDHRRHKGLCISPTPEIIAASRRHLHAVGVFTHENAIDHPLHLKRPVHKPFGVATLIMKAVKLLFRQGDEGAFMSRECLKFLRERIRLKLEAVVAACVQSLLHDSLLVDTFFEKTHKNLVKVIMLAVHSEVSRVGYYPGQQARGAVEAHVAIKATIAAISRNTSSHVDDMSGYEIMRSAKQSGSLMMVNKHLAAVGAPE